MVRVAFIVEGATDKIVIESSEFTKFANSHGIEICPPVQDATGGGNLLPQNIAALVTNARKSKPDHIVILTDLEDAPDPQAVRNRIGTDHTDLIFVAVKAIEAWFLADTPALSKWLNTDYCETYPEATVGMPWDRLKTLASDLRQRGPGSSKPAFAKRMVRLGFSLTEAARHPHCPSASNFHDGLTMLNNTQKGPL